MKKILFVCTGNICRSPTAEAIAKHKAKQLNIFDKFYFDSAATHNHHENQNPDERAIKIGDERNISFNGIKSRKITANDFSDFDHILCMTNQHLLDLRKMADEKFHPKIDLLVKFSQIKNNSNNQVNDPYYFGEEAFEDMFSLIENSIEAIFEKIYPIA